MKSSYILLFVEKAQTMASFNIQLTPGSGSVFTMWWNLWDRKKESFWVFTWSPIFLYRWKATFRGCCLRYRLWEDFLKLPYTPLQICSTEHIVDSQALREFKSCQSNIRCSRSPPWVLPLHSFAPLFPRNLRLLAESHGRGDLVGDPRVTTAFLLRRGLR